MLLQRLREYADERLELPPVMYQEQPIRYLFRLDQRGRMIGEPIDTADPGAPATKYGKRRLAPHVKRAYGIRPKLLADTAVYALGVPTEDAKPERVRQQHDAFLTLVEACGRATRLPEVEAVVSFLMEVAPTEMSLPQDFDPGAHLTFIVDDVFPIDLPAVREFWAAMQGPGDEAEGEAKTAEMPCIVCGKVRPVLSRHPLKVKGIPGGQMSGTDLISANARAFESYGLGNSLISPTCQPCAEKYGNALNALLAGKETHLRMADLVDVFWTAIETGFNPGALLSEPTATEVQQLRLAVKTGSAAATDIDSAAFYSIGLGASGGRAVVRDWIDTTVQEAKRRMVRYFALQEIVDAYGAPWEPMAIWRLAGATVRDPRKETPPLSVPRALLGLAWGGDPLPLDLLFQVVRRIRADGEVGRERAALIKMVLGCQPDATAGESEAMTDMNEANNDPAYLCGRLLALLDAIQQRALNNPNATIVDKFYGTASSAPAAVFGTLLHGTQAHMAKLRKDPRTERAHAALERRLEEMMAPLETFPKTLTLQDQGLFALGFYHQRAADRRARRERAAANVEEAEEGEGE